MNREILVQNIERYCAQKGVKPTNACRESGVGSSFLTDIKRGQTPSVAKMLTLAQYLGCTVSDLLGEEQKKQPAPEGDELRERIDALNQQEREEALRFLDYLRAKRKMP